MLRKGGNRPRRLSALLAHFTSNRMSNPEIAVGLGVRILLEDPIVLIGIGFPAACPPLNGTPQSSPQLKSVRLLPQSCPILHGLLTALNIPQFTREQKKASIERPPACRIQYNFLNRTRYGTKQKRQSQEGARRQGHSTRRRPKHNIRQPQYRRKKEVEICRRPRFRNNVFCPSYLPRQHLHSLATRP